MDINKILTHALKCEASDIHLKHGVRPVIRRHGKLEVLDSNLERVNGKDIAKMTLSLMTPSQKDYFKENNEIDIGYNISGLGRFRLNVFKQMGLARAVFRNIPLSVPDFQALHLPRIVEKIANIERGLVLITGVTGSGKTTTSASIIDYINKHKKKHIITIEDPIEFALPDRRSLVSQRELRSDTPSFVSALRSALRQDPDVIFVGEMRDQETVNTALLAAETGHLVISTLHTANTQESMNRILMHYESHQQIQVRNQLANTLKAIVCQRLANRKDGQGVIPVVEVMINNARIKELILDPQRTSEIHSAIEDGFVSFGMQSFDQSLMQLITNGIIDYGEAERLSTNAKDFSLRYKGIQSGSDRKWKGFEKTAIESKTYWDSVPKLEVESIVIEPKRRSKRRKHKK